MKAFDGFRVRAGEYYLKKAIKLTRQKRNTVFSTFESATSVGIIARVEDVKKLSRVKEYVKQLKSEYGIRKVVVLGYHDEKALPEGIQQGLDFHILSRKNINWYARPSGTEYKDFVRQDFDMLLDLTRIDCVPLSFAVAESRAKFKIGLYNEVKKELYDFMFMLKSDSIDDLFREINHYLATKSSAAKPKNEKHV